MTEPTRPHNAGPPAGPAPLASDDEQAYDVFLRAFDEAPIGMLLIRPDGSYARVNRLILRYTGRSHEEVLAAPRGSHTHPDDRPRVQETLRRLRAGESTVETATVRILTASGRYSHFDAVLRGIYRSDGRLRIIVAQLVDVTALRMAEVSLAEQRQRDPRSGALLETVFEQCAADAVRTGDAEWRWVMLAIGFDATVLRTRLGSSAVAPWEQRLADLVRGELPRGALLGERGANALVCALPLRDEAAAGDVASGIRAALERVAPGGAPERPALRCAASPVTSAEAIAIAIHEALFALEKGETYETQLVWATDALRRARERRQWIAEELPHALRSGELELHYQPIVDLGTSETTGGEALLRWRGPDRPPPAEFVPVAERVGLIAELDWWVAETAIRQWSSAFHGSGLDLHINASAHTLENVEFAGRVLACCTGTGCAASDLVIELTESAHVQNARGLGEAILRLKGEGVRFAVDDFGAGNAWFDRVSGYVPQVVKLDMQFARGIGTQVGHRLAAAAIATGQAVDATIIAEGVEQAAQAAIFRQLGAHRAQGYFYGPAVPLEEFVRRRP